MPGKKKNYTLGQDLDAGLHDITLPSGQTCQARRPGAQGLIEAGLLDSFDQLTAIVKTDHIDANTPRGIAARDKVTKDDQAAAVQAMIADPEKIGVAFSLIDRLTAYVVTQPPLWVDYKLKVKDEAEKDGERIETDQEFAKRQKAATEIGAFAVRVVDMDDKMWLLQWAMGGTSSLTSFREGSQESVADVESGQAV